MMSPQEVLQGQRNIAPRTGFTPKVEGVRTGRDDRRRATHNEGNDFYEPWETDTKWFLIGAKKIVWVKLFLLNEHLVVLFPVNSMSINILYSGEKKKG